MKVVNVPSPEDQQNSVSSFDEVIDRFGTDSPKWDAPDVPPGGIAASVADMDFPCSEPIRRAMAERAELGVFGYTVLAADHFDVVSRFLAYQHGWAVPTEQMLYCNRVVQALYLVLEQYTEVGDAVLIHTPAYSPLMTGVQRAGRTLITQPLENSAGKYEIDFEALERSFAAGVRIFLFVNPHNPTGRVWTTEEMRQIADLCHKYSVLIFSDDVHADFVRPGYQHTFISSLDEGTANRTITCTSPGKTFNVPGLEITHLIIPHPQMRREIRALSGAVGFHNPSFFASAVTRAAYEDSLPWLISLRSYLEDNLELLLRTFETEMPQLQVTPPEGTYLAWVRGTGEFSAPEILEKLARDAQISVSPGTNYGKEFGSFFRINYAMPRSVLQKLLDQLCSSYASTAENSDSV